MAEPPKPSAKAGARFIGVELWRDRAEAFGEGGQPAH
jgi:hypothetical protein